MPKAIVKINNLTECIKKLGDIAGISLSQPIQKIAEKIRNDAQEEAPKFMGRLAGSITRKPLGRSYNDGAVVYTNLEYAPYVEYGTKKPHFVPFVDRQGKETGIREWAERKGMPVEQMGGLNVSGKAKPFMKPAAIKNEKSSKQEIIDYIKKQIKEKTR